MGSLEKFFTILPIMDQGMKMPCRITIQCQACGQIFGCPTKGYSERIMQRSNFQFVVLILKICHLGHGLELMFGMSRCLDGHG